MAARKRSLQLLSRCLGNVRDRVRGVYIWTSSSDDDSGTSRSGGDASHTSCGSTNRLGTLPLPTGLGVGSALRQHRPHHLGALEPGSAAQVRHLSWRRYVPSLGDFRNAAEAPDRQVTNLLLAINIATFVAAKFDRSVAMSMAMIPYQVAAGDWHRLLTCGFLHLDFLHLLANMLSVHWLGPGVESAVGRGRFAAIYLASIVGGSWAQYHFGTWAAMSLGASGGVFGLIGAYLVYRFRNRGFIAWDAGDTSWLMQVVGINVALGLMAGSSISQIAHLGGALAGAGTCWLIGPRYRWSHGRVVDQPLLPLFRTRE